MNQRIYDFLVKNTRHHTPDQISRLTELLGERLAEAMDLALTDYLNEIKATLPSPAPDPMAQTLLGIRGRQLLAELDEPSALSKFLPPPGC